MVIVKKQNGEVYRKSWQMHNMLIVQIVNNANLDLITQIQRQIKERVELVRIVANVTQLSMEMAKLKSAKVNLLIRR